MAGYPSSYPSTIHTHYSAPTPHSSFPSSMPLQPAFPGSFVTPNAYAFTPPQPPTLIDAPVLPHIPGHSVTLDEHRRTVRAARFPGDTHTTVSSHANLTIAPLNVVVPHAGPYQPAPLAPELPPGYSDLPPRAYLDAIAQALGVAVPGLGTLPLTSAFIRVN